MSQETKDVRTKRPLTPAALAARRANAARSTGPKTPAGKARSSRNALKHGFFAQTALLYYESPDDYVALRDAYFAEYQPEGPTEMYFVMEMANAQYRLRRVRGMEADLIQKLITRDICASGLSNGEIQAEAVRTLADSSGILQLLQRYEVMFRRQYERALRHLWEHRDRLRRQAAERRQNRPARPAQARAATLQALHALLLAPTPGELPVLRNEPEIPQPNAFATTSSQSATPPPGSAPPAVAAPSAPPASSAAPLRRPANAGETPARKSIDGNRARRPSVPRSPAPAPRRRG